MKTPRPTRRQMACLLGPAGRASGHAQSMVLYSTVTQIRITERRFALVSSAPVFTGRPGLIAKNTVSKVRYVLEYNTVLYT
jgi:hypothetical protein